MLTHLANILVTARRAAAARRQHRELQRFHELANAYLGDALVFVEARDAWAANQCLRKAMAFANKSRNGRKAMAIARVMHALKRSAAQQARNMQSGGGYAY